MRLSSSFAFGALLISYALDYAVGRQFPVVNGVPGGVPDAPRSRTNNRLTLLSEDTSSATRTPGHLRVVENSGICETTAGVYQASGYGDIAANKSIWFWFFAARNNPDTAPFTIWINGGPGSSSMLGLFQEHGPCRITNDSSSIVANPYSWNTDANIIYIDQPVGSGFSFGETVGTSEDAAADIWAFIQIFFSDSRYSKYQQRPLSLWTESYGGHYGPTFAAHFLKKNEDIDNGSVQGQKLNLQVLGIGNGLTNPLVQYAGYMAYAASNPYHQLVPTANITAANQTWIAPDGCRVMIEGCYAGTGNCTLAQSYCNVNILGPLAGTWDNYDVRSRYPDPYPPDITDYINSIRDTIGADVIWEESSTAVYDNFTQNGDWMKNSAPLLEQVINAGVRTLIYDGDADYIVNFRGVEMMVDNLQTKFSDQYRGQQWQNYTVNGQETGQYKSAGCFAYLRVYGSGHEVPAFSYGNLAVGQAALQFFNQITSGNDLKST